MAFEYLVVLFPRRRRVKLNGAYGGITNKLLEVKGGEYTVTLGPPDNFEPGEQKVVLRNTSAFTPAIISFRDVNESDEE